MYPSNYKKYRNVNWLSHPKCFTMYQESTELLKSYHLNNHTCTHIQYLLAIRLENITELHHGPKY